MPVPGKLMFCSLELSGKFFSSIFNLSFVKYVGTELADMEGQLKKINWNVLDLQCCVSFRCMEDQLLIENSRDYTDKLLQLIRVQQESWLQNQHAKINCIFYTINNPGGSVVKNLLTNAESAGSVPESGRSPGERNGKLLQYSCLGNPMDRGDWWATVHGVARSRTWLSDWTTKIQSLR